MFSFISLITFVSAILKFDTKSAMFEDSRIHTNTSEILKKGNASQNANYLKHEEIIKFKRTVFKNNIKQTQSNNPLQVVSVKRIWGYNNHDAFTSLVERNGVLYCAFRHSSGHNTRDGVIKVIKSTDGNFWKEEREFSIKNMDMRDPKLSITSNGDLVLIGLSRSSSKENNRHFTYIWKLSNRKWSGPFLGANSKDTWKWGVNRVGNDIYSIAYSGKDKFGTMYRTRDGISWFKVSERIFPEIKDYPNESAFIELEDNSLVALLRKNEGNKKAKLGMSKPPYKAWRWTDLDKQVGGPSLIKLPNNRVLACVRLYNPVRTSVCELNIKKGTLDELVKLPSGNDTSYAGMVLFKGALYVSYYSNHEAGKGKSAIYLAKFKI